MTELRWDRVPLVGSQVIEASAGTGKTYTITTLVLRLLLERGLDLGQILVVTFTRAAAAELRDRIRARLRRAVAAFETAHLGGDEEVAALFGRSQHRERDRRRLVMALRELDEAPIHTIHGFCGRALGEHAFESGGPFEVEAVAEDHTSLTALVADFWTQEVASAAAPEVRYLREHAPFSSLVALARRAAAQPDIEVVPAAVEANVAAAAETWAAVQARARAVWQVDREGILALLLGHPGLNRNRYRLSSIPNWISAVDELLMGTLPVDAGLLDGAHRFTRQGLVEGCKKQAAPPEHAFFPLAEELIAAHGVAMLALQGWLISLQQRLVARARGVLGAERRRAGIVTFDDLLLRLRDALARPGGDRLATALVERYPAALVDEFQDTDPVQYEIFRRIYARPGATLVLIGDPKQAIYTFRGADLFAYLAAVRDAGGEPQTLDTSYRSDPRLIAAIHRVFTRSRAPFLLDAVRYQAVTPRPGATERLATPGAEHAALELVVVGSGEAPPRARPSGEILLAAAAAEVRRWLDSGAAIDGVPIRASDLAVLTRTNLEAETVQAELTELGVPSVLYGDRSVLDTPEAVEVGHVLAALSEPLYGGRVRAALATRLVGVNGVELARLATDDRLWEVWSGRFVRWHERWRKRGFINAFRALLHELDVIPRLLGEPRGERRLTNVLHLAELLHDIATRRHLGPLALGRWFSAVRHDTLARDVEVADQTQVRLESDADAVRVVTMHRSKGLEYPIVVCASLCSPPSDSGSRSGPVLFHDPDQDYRPRLHLGGSGWDRAATAAADEALAEGLRLAYVALTRARHQVTAITRVTAGVESSPLGYLLHSRTSELEPPQRAGRRQVASEKQAALLADLHRFAGDDPATIRVRPAEYGTDPPAPVPARSELEVTVLPTRRRFALVRRLTSYTGLVARAPDDGGVDEPDHDELAAMAEPFPAAIPIAEAGGGAPPSAAEAALDEPVLLGAFPRGTGPGNALHAMLERVDFAGSVAGLAQPVVELELQRHGLDREAWGALVTAALAEIVQTPLAAGGPRLAELAPRSWRCEVEFTLPVRPRVAGSTPERALDASILARMLAAHGGDAMPSAYPARIAGLGFGALVGHLRGFIDLVFEYAGRFYIVDYKSNFLGERWRDYMSPALTMAMVEHDYFLQAYLYSVALHRHLRRRQPDYDYDRHFGGVYYLFLRGMCAERGPTTGVFAEHPPRALVEGLSRALDGESAEGDP
ncbi:MAG: exodeoxyribonuclease V subunit beta [Polyangiaceae bacterium]|nr:exodeoxyribonuclease V subunit beta [Polyangiaceae bacterium]